MRICELKGIFSGAGFAKNQGRKPKLEDAHFVSGPVDLVIDTKSKKIVEITSSSLANKFSGETFDGRGLVATAGFCDSHTHALFAGERAREYFLRWSGKSYQEIAAAGGGIHNSVKATDSISDHALQNIFFERLQHMLAHGSTRIEVKSGYGVDGAGELRLLRLLKDCQRKASPSLPKFYVNFLGLHALPAGRKEADFVDEMISLLDQVQAENLAVFADAFPEKGFFSVAESVRFIKAAQARGLKAKIHADELSDMNATQTFSEIGAVSVDHLQKISACGIAALSVKSTVATLLPATSFFLGLPYANARNLINAGARVALASDFNPGTAPVSSLLFTAQLAAAQLKMSAAEILCAITFNAAAAMALENECGTLEKGKAAEFLLWQSSAQTPQNILEEIFVAAQKPSFVWRNAKCVS